MKFLSGASTKKTLVELRQFILIVLAVLVSRVLLAEPYYVPSGSMEPTLAIGDDLVTSKFAYGYSRYSMLFGWGP
ncbi:MAG TPA: S26 family signal peptidase, partial [Magnetospirillaceae bacterium]|nr:S26 family signal peptidase [Magnetospirillaceae bacterium]